jgi:CheY-like chemotaxis protein
MTILNIDDSRFIRLANSRALVRAGYNVIEAGDGEDGLQIAKEQQPDLILLDMMLPKISGPELLRVLKQNPLTSSIPVIVLTSLSSKNKDRLIAQGAAGFVEKSNLTLAHDSAALVQEIEAIVKSSTVRGKSKPV